MRIIGPGFYFPARGSFEMSFSRDCAPLVERYMGNSLEDLLGELSALWLETGVTMKIKRREHLVRDVTSEYDREAIIEGVAIELAHSSGDNQHADVLLAAKALDKYFMVFGKHYAKEQAGQEIQLSTVREEAKQTLLSGIQGL